MLLSIIIPYYNRNAWIGRALDSLLDQDLAPDDFEILVIDDGSDEEPVVLKEYAGRVPQVCYYRTDHIGQALARNYGLSVAKGEWIYFCDSDDFVQPQIFGGILRAAQERNLEMIVARFVLINENDPMPACPRRNFAAMSETMTGLEYLSNPRVIFNWGVGSYWVKRSVLQENGIAFENIRFGEDRLFKLALYQVLSRIATIDVDAYYYVQHESSFFHEQRKRNNQEFIDAFVLYLERLAALADRPDTPQQVAEALRNRITKSAVYTLKNAFLYGTVERDASTLSRLEALGAYPLPINAAKESRHVRIVKWLMNHRGLWLFLHRFVHLLPDRFIQKHFQV